MHRLYLCKGVRSPNDCPWYDTKLSDDLAQKCWRFGILEYPFIAISPRSTLARRVVPDRVLSMGEIELFDI